MPERLITLLAPPPLEGILGDLSAYEQENFAAIVPAQGITYFEGFAEEEDSAAAEESDYYRERLAQFECDTLEALAAAQDFSAAASQIMESALGLVDEASGQYPQDDARLLRLIEDLGRFMESAGCGQHNHFAEAVDRLPDRHQHAHDDDDRGDEVALAGGSKDKTGAKKALLRILQGKREEKRRKPFRLFEMLGRLILLDWLPQPRVFSNKNNRVAKAAPIA